jgi:hypothetical protein
MGMAGSRGRMQPKPKSKPKPKQLEGKLTGARGAIRIRPTQPDIVGYRETLTVRGRVDLGSLSIGNDLSSRIVG